MLSRLSLFQKSLTLVMVPLIVQCFFVFTLNSMLQQAEAEIKKEEQARIFVIHINALMRKIIGSAAHVVLPNKQHKTAPEYAIQEEFDKIKSITKDRETFEEIEKTEKQWKEALKYAIRLRETVDKKVSMGTAFEIAEMQEILQEIYLRLTRIGNAAEKVISNSPRKQTKARKKIRDFMFIGLGFNVGLAILLVWLFNKSTTERLYKLMTKARKIESGEQIEPPASGKDEITELDLVLSEVSGILKKSTDELKQTDLKIRSILETLPIGVMIIREQGEIDYVNPTMEELWQTPQLTFVGSLISNYLDLPDTDIATLLEQQINKGTYETDAFNDDGYKFPIEFITREVSWSDEKRRFLVAIQDISERKRIEKLRSDFTAMLTHNVRSPLNSLLAFIELLSRGKYGELNERGKESVKTVENGIDLIVSLISDLLDLDKIEAGLLELKIAKTSTDKIVDRALSSLKNLAELKAINLTTQVKSIDLEADQDRIVQVVVNLVSNAINHSDKGTDINISAEPNPKKKHNVLFSVTDNGPGIPKEKLESIFDRFTQVSTMRKGGSGLGLTISKALVEDHGGYILVSSEEGQGSCFSFSIPIKQEV